MRSQVLERVKGVAQQKISLKTFRELRLPVPPRTEQDLILERVRQQLGAEAMLRRTLRDCLRDAQALERVVLHAAFTGALFASARADQPRAAEREGLRHLVLGGTS